MSYVVAESVEFVCVLKCLATDLAVDEMAVVVVEVMETAEVVVDTTEVLHVIMIGIMKGNIQLNHHNLNNNVCVDLNLISNVCWYDGLSLRIG